MQTETTLTVSEIFYSIQGESRYAGYPCLFIRLSGCNLRCSFCDARYTYEEPGQEMTVAEILEEVHKTPGVMVEVTGGEPLLQDGIYPLLDELLADGRTVLIETNGSLDIRRIPAGVVRIMDLKCPDSNMHQQMNLDNLADIRPTDEIKFVLSSRRDYEWCREMIHKQGLAKKVHLACSPVTSSLSPADLGQWLMEDKLPCRLQLQ
ncbi:MAG: 7-carboxy-7-deazaguanine synthase QueE, partial [Desulfobulbaceae bacterium]|nr:7-carboxy-7-deazaguanine synthase QueE [Desulfobulbaceae bacterium]